MKRRRGLGMLLMLFAPIFSTPVAMIQENIPHLARVAGRSITYPHGGSDHPAFRKNRKKKKEQKNKKNGRNRYSKRAEVLLEREERRGG
ncbi:MAG: hypothetical protein NUV61_01415 [Candidatus Azambacteria bacterium]|nr:hypothetical protein [Candidatus Azambacteria bacterium]